MTTSKYISTSITDPLCIIGGNGSVIVLWSVLRSDLMNCFCPIFRAYYIAMIDVISFILSVICLLDNGIIRQFSVEIDCQKLGYDLKVLISMKFKNDDFRKFIADLEKFPEVLNCKRVTGEYCLITECILRDSSHLKNLIDRLTYGIPTTSIQLSEINRQKI